MVDGHALLPPELQRTLLGEAAYDATVGFLVWDDDGRYVAANACACELLGATLEEVIGSAVGARTVDGRQAVRDVVAGRGGWGTVTVERFDGERIRLGYVSFTTRTAGLPYMGSIIWADDAPPWAAA